MSIFEHPNGYYGYNFMYKRKRYSRSFKGLTKSEVENLETIAKAELIKNGYDISTKKTVYLSEIIQDYKLYEQDHCSNPGNFNYVIEKFYRLVGNKDIEQITPSDIEKYIRQRKLDKVKNKKGEKNEK